MTPATADHFAYLRHLRDERVLLDLQGDLIPAQCGTILISCSDGHRIIDTLTNHWRVCSGHQCHHTLLLNGGPLLIPQGSPVTQHGEDDVLLQHMLGGACIKSISTVVMYGHWPCSMALSFDLGPAAALGLCVKAKDRSRSFLAERDVNPKVILCFHVDWPSGRKRSYYFDRRKWEQLQEQSSLGQF